MSVSKKPPRDLSAFERLARGLLNVPKKELDAKRAEYEDRKEPRRKPA